jgi:hypothetical protein
VEKAGSVGMSQPTSDEKLDFNLVQGVPTYPSAFYKGSSPKGAREFCGTRSTGELPQ